MSAIVKLLTGVVVAVAVFSLTVPTAGLSLPALLRCDTALKATRSFCLSQLATCG